MRQRWREEESEREKERGKRGRRKGKRVEGVIPSCNLAFPQPFCPWAAVPPSSN